MGPRLGPLVVTGVLARCSARGRAHLRALALGGERRIDDSKKLASFHKPQLAEAWARALCPGAASPDELLVRLSLLGQDELRAPCPTHVIPQCWGPTPSFEAPASLVAELTVELDELRAAGVLSFEARTVIVCPSVLHDTHERGLSLMDVDLRAMERLLLWFREQSTGDIDAVCGKVGGLDRYLRRLDALGAYPATTIEEGKAASTYRLAGLGLVSWVRDADGADALVALSSLVGKYVRELTMGKIAHHYLARDASLPRPSGYRDPVTARFVEGTREQRRLDLIPERCFERPRKSST